ncbi:YktB family protein [Paenibacillus radicis (ex Xue et al. 2023)]|uniref:UPF0637 protein NV381_20420 n=1 Tax=Paenibacillus radicis (ex Xue et al. 2023) TaxID=2972489 RepID=A0ABT1YK44_9BACL|nr:DUF1054 domain-containing protein [Paenibacillus radicis (ex Xue et al. 2023)]MCR8633551.1 DUF1054 domain-containing protein [Paenibacillus radicis (ex Xue et al. 2023)]
MTFSGFTQTDFDVFTIPGLEARMEGIQGHIQPKFKELGQELCDEAAMLAGNEMFLHIAKHARRKVNAPVDTWMAVCDNKRGYKQHPHFQVGLFDDRVFIWLALIYELPNKQNIAQRYLNNLKQFRSSIPKQYVLSFDHMKKDAIALQELNDQQLTEALCRFRDVKKAELLIGLNLDSSNPVLTDGEAFVKLAKETVTSLMPLYKMACQA